MCERLESLSELNIEVNLVIVNYGLKRVLCMDDTYSARQYGHEGDLRAVPQKKGPINQPASREL